MGEEQKGKQLEAMQTMVALAKERTKMAKKRTAMSQKRTELSAKRSYMNAERTLSVWIRTALAAMIFGIAIDRFGLMFSGTAENAANLSKMQYNPSAITGAVLVFFSMLMAISAALRFMKFARLYKKEYRFPAHHNASLPVIYAFMIVIFGAVLLALMLGII